ncbi:MAG TPA: ATP-grasp domain-containing protein [Candidatus Binatia bacterium]|nr:ATP-grasp domain-containing protein [Candidatus Binatia bacterium]
MTENKVVTILCLASYYKGTAFLRKAKELGCHVILLAKDTLQNEDWPDESIDERFFMPDLRRRPDIIFAVSYLARDRQIDRIVPLDDYDVETAASLREHLRLPGIGESLVRHFRDKLAMRMQAASAGIAVPAFVSTFNYDRIREFMDRVPPPWVLKPRSEAGAMGIKKIADSEQLWRWLDKLGDEQSFFLLEQYVPGDVCHVDGIVSEKKVVFAVAHRYGAPPMNVAHEGGVFVTRTLPHAGEEAQELLALNERLMEALGMVRGATHTEFIREQDGNLYFLETAARVGGANIDQVVEAATGVNLWQEWARIEAAHARGETYQPPRARKGYAGLLLCLAQQEWPDLSQFDDPGVVWRLHKRHHAGLVVAADNAERVQTLLDSCAVRFARDFLAVAPPLDKPPA